MRRVEMRAVGTGAFEEIRKYSTGADAKIPIDLHRTWDHYRLQVDESDKELSGCIRSVASLSCVDGLVLLDGTLSVRGFGVEITISGESSPSVCKAGDELATPELLEKENYERFGTRHRSMLRYCDWFEGSIGFVISQDGDVRAITKVSDKMVLWENIKLHHIHDPYQEAYELALESAFDEMRRSRLMRIDESLPVGPLDGLPAPTNIS